MRVIIEKPDIYEESESPENETLADQVVRLQAQKEALSQRLFDPVFMDAEKFNTEELEEAVRLFRDISKWPLNCVLVEIFNESDDESTCQILFEILKAVLPDQVEGMADIVTGMSDQTLETPWKMTMINELVVHACAKELTPRDIPGQYDGIQARGDDARTILEYIEEKALYIPLADAARACEERAHDGPEDDGTEDDGTEDED